MSPRARRAPRGEADDRFAFLSPAAAAGDGDSAPRRRTPMERNHLAAGASVVDRDGWRLAEYATDDGGEVWIADLSHLGKLELRGREDAVDEATGGVALGHARATDGTWALRITPTRALVVCPFAQLADTAGALERALDVTSVFAAFVIGGPGFRELFARISALDVRPAAFPAGRVMAGSVARCPAIVLNRSGGEHHQLLVLVGWEFGQYAWETVLDAGAPLGVRVVSPWTVAEPAEVAA